MQRWNMYSARRPANAATCSWGTLNSARSSRCARETAAAVREPMRRGEARLGREVLCVPRGPSRARKREPQRAHVLRPTPSLFRPDRWLLTNINPKGFSSERPKATLVRAGASVSRFNRWKHRPIKKRERRVDPSLEVDSSWIKKWTLTPLCERLDYASWIKKMNVHSLMFSSQLKNNLAFLCQNADLLKIRLNWMLVWLLCLKDGSTCHWSCSKLLTQNSTVPNKTPDYKCSNNT